MSEEQMNVLMAELPSYYKKSRHMRAIMDAVSGYLPADSDIWKAFFIHLMYEPSLELWRRELDAADDEDLLAKLRATNGRMTVESVLAQGFGLQESYRLMPEDGLVLSDFGVLADGWEFAPLTSVIYATPETVGIARGIVKLMGLAGFRYLFGVRVAAYLKTKQGKTTTKQTRFFTTSNFKERDDDEVSGRKMDSGVSRTQYFSSICDGQRKNFWSPNITFLDDLTFVDKLVVVQRSKITVIP
ncbi:hypothetical protein [Brevibacillus sp. 1238]|uniref:hypothetical protein n=1 Tax=Brevibacillus sp. 1238 TaxID=2940565 RepID=UPI002476AB16|nr:hypothetical protein [Brevibacillus sp. 1238]MDH6351937.1 hypothetical protein [Brevibacillus sp. 1238]